MSVCATALRTISCTCTLHVFVCAERVKHKLVMSCIGLTSVSPLKIADILIPDDIQCIVYHRRPLMLILVTITAI